MIPLIAWLCVVVMGFGVSMVLNLNRERRKLSASTGGVPTKRVRGERAIDSRYMGPYEPMAAETPEEEADRLLLEADPAFAAELGVFEARPSCSSCGHPWKDHDEWTVPQGLPGRPCCPKYRATLPTPVQSTMYDDVMSENYSETRLRDRGPKPN